MADALGSRFGSVSDELSVLTEKTLAEAHEVGQTGCGLSFRNMFFEKEKLETASGPLRRTVYP